LRCACSSYCILRLFSTYDSPRTQIYTLSLRRSSDLDERPRRRDPAVARERAARVPRLRRGHHPRPVVPRPRRDAHPRLRGHRGEDRKSTRLNSSHVKISYAVFCLKKKKKSTTPESTH